VGAPDFRCRECRNSAACTARRARRHYRRRLWHRVAIKRGALDRCGRGRRSFYPSRDPTGGRGYDAHEMASADRHSFAGQGWSALGLPGRRHIQQRVPGIRALYCPSGRRI
jgi:hypothetical protein